MPTVTKTKQRRVTMTTIKRWGACYDDEKLDALAQGRSSITALQILDLPISAKDRLWAVLRTDFFTENELILLSADFAEHTLFIFEREYPTDNRPRSAIDTARRFANGNATQAELDASAASAAWAARAASDASAASAAWAARAARAARAASAAMAASDAMAASAESASWAARAAWAARAESAESTARAAEEEWQIEQVRKALTKVL